MGVFEKPGAVVIRTGRGEILYAVTLSPDAMIGSYRLRNVQNLPNTPFLDGVGLKSSGGHGGFSSPAIRAGLKGLTIQRVLLFDTDSNIFNGFAPVAFIFNTIA